MTRLPQVHELALNFSGVDIIQQPVPIQPTAHYSMGGIPTDVNGQVLAAADGTPLIGFFAAGECACVSVHGANRLGTNSLLEASLFGRRTGQAMAEFILNGAELHPMVASPQTGQEQRINGFYDGESRESVAKIGAELKQTMTENVGVFRNEERLKRAMGKIKELQARFEKARSRDKSRRFNTDMLATIETEHLLTFAELITLGALNRTESRGAHFRTDHPKRDDENWLKHTMVHKAAEPKFDYKGVTVFWDRYPPQERKY